MRMSNLFGKTIKETPRGAQLPSHIFMLRGGFVRQYSAGVYALLPLALRSMQKIERICREEMNKVDGQEIRMSCMATKDLWDETGRYDGFGVDMFKFADRNKKQLALNPTHEELMVFLARTDFTTHKQLPAMLYQLQTKFRDEPRPRGGLIRLREFMMKDAYSFHLSEENLKSHYDKVYEAYVRFFTRTGCRNFVSVMSDNGLFGGNYSHEFQMLVPTGEDKLIFCKSCKFGSNEELTDSPDRRVKVGEKCPECSDTLTEVRGIEIGNIFHLGTKYTKAMNCTVVNESGEKVYPTMGCYGIGLTRLLPAIIEESHDDRGPILPLPVAPYEVHVCILNKQELEINAAAEKLYEDLKAQNIEVLFDDRDEKPGSQFADADLMGIPFRIILSRKTLAEQSVEFKYRDNRAEVRKVKIEDIVGILKSEIDDEYKKFN